jgi:putative phosphoesterase
MDGFRQPTILAMSSSTSSSSPAGESALPEVAGGLGHGVNPGLIAVGVLSDTHGHLYSEVKELLAGVVHIIHAGDVGSAQVLAELRSLAPVTAVRGNCDFEAWAQVLPANAQIELAGVRIFVGHVPAQTRAWAADRLGSDNRVAAVISGHSHLAAVERSEGVLYVNAGSAGPRRFGRPRTVVRLLIRPATEEGGTAAGAQISLPQVQAEICTAAGE